VYALTDPLQRWRDGWEGTDRIVVASDRDPSLGDESRTVLESAGLEIVLAPMHDASGKLSAEAAQAEVLISGGTVLEESDFAAMTRARFLLRPYVGYDDIDVDAATEQGILFANVPDTFVEEVANQTLALLLALNRRLAQMDQFVRSGRWFAGEKPREVAHPIKRLSRMTLGLLGFGGIGRLVAQRATPFDFRIIAHDPYIAPESAVGTGVRLVPREALLEEADILSLHVLLNRQTRGMVDASWFAMMKPTAVLINTSRGPIVNEPDLIEALRNGRIAAAGLDVMEAEPLSPSSPLCAMNNVILSPHIASYSDEGDVHHRQRIGQLAAQVALGAMPERKVVVNKSLYDQIDLLPEMKGVKRS
jgi:D-3-phosphoglycerate dehydrogenase